MDVLRNLVVWASLLIAVLGAAMPSSAQVDRPEALYGHGWLLYRDAVAATDRMPASVDTIVLHAPPRLAPDEKSRGVLGFAPAFPSGVDAAAWHRHEVYFVLFGQHRTGNGTVRSTARLRAWRTMVDTYEFTPARAENLPPIWGEVSVIGLAASEAGVLALLRQEDRPPEASMTPMARVGAPGELVMRVLGDGDWSEVSVPPALAELSTLDEARVRSSVFVVAQREALGVLIARPGEAEATLLVGRPERLSEGVFGPPALLAWTSSKLPLGTGGLALDGALFVRGWAASDDALIGWQTVKSSVRLLRLTPEGPGELATIQGVGEGAMVVPMASPASASPGRVVVTWGQPPSVRPAARGAGATAAKRGPIELREVSVLSGQTLFDGPARNFEIISGRSLQLLAAALLVMMVAVILFVVRAEPGKPPELPADLELASPVRRALAWLLDYAVAALLAAQLLGLPALSLVRLSQIAQMDTALLGVGLAMLLAMAQSVATETFFGRSLGKMAVGLRVYSTAARRAGPEDGDASTPVVTELSEPRVWQVLLRNLIRWTIPAVGLLAMFDGGRRHPGDLLGKTIVLSQREPEQPEDGM